MEDEPSFDLGLKRTSWACLVVSRLKFISHWVTPLLILSKSLLKLFAGLNVINNREQRLFICKKLCIR